MLCGDFQQFGNENENTENTHFSSTWKAGQLRVYPPIGDDVLTRKTYIDLKHLSRRISTPNSSPDRLPLFSELEFIRSSSTSSSFQTLDSRFHSNGRCRTIWRWWSRCPPQWYDASRVARPRATAPLSGYPLWPALILFAESSSDRLPSSAYSFCRRKWSRSPPESKWSRRPQRWW